MAVGWVVVDLEGEDLEAVAEEEEVEDSVVVGLEEVVDSAVDSAVVALEDSVLECLPFDSECDIRQRYEAQKSRRSRHHYPADNL